MALLLVTLAGRVCTNEMPFAGLNQHRCNRRAQVRGQLWAATKPHHKIRTQTAQAEPCRKLLPDGGDFKWLI